MNIPEFLKSALLENNNSVVHSLFETEKLQDYIASYFANICLNVISVVLVAVAFYIVMKLFLSRNFGTWKANEGLDKGQTDKPPQAATVNTTSANGEKS